MPSTSSGLGITVGAHRLWAHRSFTASFPLRVFLMLCNSIANQQTIYKWVRDHRVHHKHSETDGDPHNALRGFFFAHLGWLYVKKHPEVLKAGKEIDFTDLLDDPVVWFQAKVNPLFNLYMCFVFPAQIAVRFWDESFWPALWVAGALRYIWVLHCTALVNSAAHLYGDHPYDANSHPAENPIVSLFAIGEGWHNWHHKYPFDYAASEYGVSSQYNPSKLFIDAMAALGQVWDRKRGTALWEIAKAKRDAEAAAKMPPPPLTKVGSVPSVDSEDGSLSSSDDVNETPVPLSPGDAIPRKQIPASLKLD